MTLATSSLTKPSSPASAAIMDTNTPGASTFKPGQTLGVEEAKNRFLLAIKDVDELIENYDEISKGGNGDNVRRYLGTVGVKSHMYGISKVLRELREEVDDIVEFTETIADFEAYLFQAEGAAYQSLFVEFSSAKGSPESFLATAKKDIIVMRKYMGDLAKQLKLDV
jgi:septation ring formation regulator EzrA